MEPTTISLITVPKRAVLDHVAPEREKASIHQYLKQKGSNFNEKKRKGCF